MRPVGRAVRAYVAPVERPSGTSSPFDPAAQGQFDLESPPSPWLDLGWVENFQRIAATKYETLRSGFSGSITVQYRSQPEARVVSWNTAVGPREARCQRPPGLYRQGLYRRAGEAVRRKSHALRHRLIVGRL